jgi:hypothetical protein
MDPGPTVPTGNLCVDATGDASCAYDLRVQVTAGDVQLLAFEPTGAACDIGCSLTSNILRVNRLVNTVPLIGPQKVGELTMSTLGPLGGWVKVTGVHSVGAARQLVDIPENTVAFVPEPDQLVLLLSGLAGLAALHRLRGALSGLTRLREALHCWDGSLRQAGGGRIRRGGGARGSMRFTWRLLRSRPFIAIAAAWWRAASCSCAPGLARVARARRLRPLDPPEPEVDGRGSADRVGAHRRGRHSALRPSAVRRSPGPSAGEAAGGRAPRGGRRRLSGRPGSGLPDRRRGRTDRGGSAGPGADRHLERPHRDGHEVPRRSRVGTPPPYFANAGSRVGFSDLPVDPGGTTRRSLLFLWEGDVAQISFSLQLALRYLQDEGITLQADANDPNRVRLGDTTIPPFHAWDGAYVRADDGGYQFLLDYADGPDAFLAWTLGDLLGGRIPDSALRGKIVILGTTSPSVKDEFYTPWNRELTKATMSGLKAQARGEPVPGIVGAER